MHENKQPRGCYRGKDGIVRNSKTGAIVKFPRNGGFEVIYNHTTIFSKIKTNKWPTTEFIIEAINKERERVENCIFIDRSDDKKIKVKVSEVRKPKLKSKNSKSTANLTAQLNTIKKSVNI